MRWNNLSKGTVIFITVFSVLANNKMGPAKFYCGIQNGLCVYERDLYICPNGTPNPCNSKTGAVYTIKNDSCIAMNPLTRFCP